MGGKGRRKRGERSEFIFDFCSPKITKEYPAPTPDRDPSLNHSKYTRPPRGTAQSLRGDLSGHIDI